MQFKNKNNDKMIIIIIIIIIITIIYYYTYFLAGVMSDYFNVLNGVKQGGVISPILLCIYIDDLLVILSQLGVGCYIAGNLLVLYYQMTSCKEDVI